MIALVDYGMGNLGSVDKALRHIGCRVQVSSEPAVLAEAGAIVLPGVGAFDDCMRHLHGHGLVEPLKQAIAAGKPFLGICLGLQVLFESSEEGGLAGLGVVKGRVVRFKHGLKVPQIGWNQITIERPAPHLEGIADGAWVYFVHSYYVVPKDESIIATTTEYGCRFASSIWRGNLFACQFHPEKSQAVGLKLLENFARFSGEL